MIDFCDYMSYQNKMYTPQKINQVKIMSHFRILYLVKRKFYWMCSIFEIFSRIMHPVSEFNCIFAQKY